MVAHSCEHWSRKYFSWFLLNEKAGVLTWKYVEICVKLMKASLLQNVCVGFSLILYYCGGEWYGK